MTQPSDVAAVVGAACAAAGPVNNNPFSWKSRVNELIPEIAALMSDGSFQWKQAEAILEADHVSGIYLGYEYEESSTRLIVFIMAGNSQEPETMRSDRTDTPSGKRMQARLDKVNRGDRIHIWKVVEATRKDPTKKVRYIGHFESYGPPKGAESGATAAPAQRAPTGDRQPPAGPVGAENDGAGEAGGPARPARAPGDEPADPGARANQNADPDANSGRTVHPTDAVPTGGVDELLAALNQLSTVSKLAVRAGAHALGIANFAQPADDEERATILNLIRQHSGELAP